jgi:hypothetical protein
MCSSYEALLCLGWNSVVMLINMTVHGIHKTVFSDKSKKLTENYEDFTVSDCKLQSS